MNASRRAASLAVCFAAAIPVFSGCALDGSQKASGKTAMAVTERDFHISAPRRLRAGRVDLQVTNRGPSAHELIVVRHSTGPLPLRSDGLTVDEEKLASHEVAALEPAEPGVRQMGFRLTPGTYELFCNMSGHYKGGMHQKLVVH